MKLEAKHLTPYLPYSLKVIMEGKKCNVAWMSTKNIAVHRPGGIGDYKRIQWKYAHLNIKPILKPIYEIANENLKEELYQYYESLGIDVKIVEYNYGNSNPFDITLSVSYRLMGDVFTDILINRGSTSGTPNHIFNWMCEYKIDVFGLIKDGLAVEEKIKEKASTP